LRRVPAFKQNATLTNQVEDQLSEYEPLKKENVEMREPEESPTRLYLNPKQRAGGWEKIKHLTSKPETSWTNPRKYTMKT